MLEVVEEVAGVAMVALLLLLLLVAAGLGAVKKDVMLAFAFGFFAAAAVEARSAALRLSGVVIFPFQSGLFKTECLYRF